MTRIMIVDDNEALLNLIEIMIKKGGYEPSVAMGGEKCLKMLEQEHSDLILLDIMMAHLDGWETLQFIRTNTDTASIPVAMLTGKYPSPDEVWKYAALIEDYIIKPFTFKSLMERIASILEGVEQRERTILLARERGIAQEYLDEYRKYHRYARTAESMYSIIYSQSGMKAASSEIIPERYRELREIFANAGLPLPKVG